MSIALANSGDLQIELIEQRNDAPSLYREFLDCRPRGAAARRLLAGRLPAACDAMLARGYRVGHEGQIGGPQGRFCYFETAARLGTVVELSDVSGGKGRFFERVRAAAIDWDGSDPIRESRR